MDARGLPDARRDPADRSARVGATRASPLHRPDVHRNIIMDSIITSTDGRSASREQLGGKAAALLDAAKAGLPVPEWFVVSPQALRASLTNEQQALLASPDGAATLAGRLTDVHPADSVRREIDAAVAALCPAGG